MMRHARLGLQWTPPLVSVSHVRSLVPVLVALILWGMDDRPAPALPAPALPPSELVPAADGTATQVIPVGSDRYDIGGGQRSGDGRNLFHSFERFGLGAGEIANFLSDPAIANIFSRVVGGHASIIDGQLQVSGSAANLYLINPAGLVFGPNATLNVPAAFTATTATAIGLDSGAWLPAAGAVNWAELVGTPHRFRFDPLQPGSVVNFGDLTVPTGAALRLFGGTVVNEGTLTAPSGEIAIAAVPGASLLRLSQPGQLLSLEIDPLQLTAIAQERGAFSPLALPELLTGASSAVAIGDDQRLTATPPPGTALLAGTLSTAAIAGTGGEIAIVGDRLAVTGTLDATGPVGGGTVRIGGDFQGLGPLANAQRTVIGTEAVIDVSATGNGDGGTAIVWADGATAFAGAIAARGGPLGGDGGFVEVSGRETLAVSGAIDAGAPLGQVGAVLFDPATITINDQGRENLSPPGMDAAGGTAGDRLVSILASDRPDTDKISRFALENTTGEVTLAATENITVEGSLNFAPGGQIQFQAGKNFEVAQGLGNGGRSPITAPGRSISITATNIQVGEINTAGGDLSGGNITLTATGLLATGDLDASSDRAAAGTVQLSSTGGSVTVGDVLAFSAGTGTGGGIAIEAATGINAQSLLTSAISGNGGPITLTTIAGDITATAINTQSLSNGVGGAVTLTAPGNLTPGILTVGSGPESPPTGATASPGAVTLNAGGVVNLSEGVTLNGADLVIGSTQEPATVSLPAALSSTGGDVAIATDTDLTLETDITTTGGAVRLSTPGTLSVTGAIATNGGAVTATSTGAMTLNDEIATGGGDLTATSTSGPLSLGGTVTTEGGALTLEGSEITTATLSTVGAERAGAITLLATAGNLTTADIAANHPTAAGTVKLTSNAGAIQTGTITTAGNTGGAIALTAPAGAIATGDLITTGTAAAGAVTLNAGADITLSTVDAQSTAGPGGTVEITTPGLFQATGTLGDRPPLDTATAISLSSAGSTDGRITIRHGGGDQTPRVPFTVGDASVNGTTGSLTSGSTTITPPLVITDSLESGNIRILTTQADNPNPPPNGTNGDDKTSTDGQDALGGDLNIFSETDFNPDPESENDIKGTDPVITDPPGPPVPETSPVLTLAIGGISGLPDNLWNSLFTHLVTSSLTQLQIQLPGIFQNNNPAEIVWTLEQMRAAEFGRYLKKQFVVPPLEAMVGAIQADLQRVEALTGQRAGIVYQALVEDRLELVLVPPDGAVTRQTVLNVDPAALEQAVTELRGEITDFRTRQFDYYLPIAQRLYDQIMRPLALDLQRNRLDTILFSPDAPLRGVPWAVLHDGEQFLVEQYTLSLIPSYALTQMGYRGLANARLLAGGASEFVALEPLPAVPTELAAIAQVWPGEVLLNADFTVANVRSAREAAPPAMIHLATHASFVGGEPANSFIQFWDTERLTLPEFEALDWIDPTVELLVLSACRTALGDREAALGFAGVSLQMGTRTTLASLWQVSDEATLGLMAEFYGLLPNVPIKGTALRQTQLAMLRRELVVAGGQLRGNGIRGVPLPAALLQVDPRDRDFAHPYFWSGFTMVGSPW